MIHVWAGDILIEAELFEGAESIIRGRIYSREAKASCCTGSVVCRVISVRPRTLRSSALLPLALVSDSEHVIVVAEAAQRPGPAALGSAHCVRDSAHSAVPVDELAHDWQLGDCSVGGWT